MRGVAAKFQKGTVVANRYCIDELLGTGGFGAVYRAHDRRVKGNVFALKEVVDPDTYERHSFMSECAILQRLDHYALPHVYRVFEDRDHHRVYMLMDYIDGPNLEKLCQQQPEKRFSLPRVMKMMAPIIDAVAYLHAQQPPIIHRDIKPANIIIPRTDDGAVLVDFGIAKEYEQDSTTTVIRHCSPGYGAPEHYARGTNIRTDIYSVAATFYTLLTGEVPTDALYRMAQMSSKGADPLRPVNALVPALSVEVAEVLMRAMAIDWNERFATVEEFWQALQNCQTAKPAEAIPAYEISLEQSVASSMVTPLLFSPLTSPVITVRKVSQVTLRQRSIVVALCCVALIALLSGVAWGAGFLSWGEQVVHVVRAASTRFALLPPGSSSAVQSPTVSLMSTPRSVVATPTGQPTTPAYPVLTTRYEGTISNKYTTPSTDTSMSLSQLQQSGAAIRGYFSVGTGLVGDGNFTGTVTTDSKIQFLVPGYDGLLPLFFTGQIQMDGSISGSYCSYEEDHCNYAGGGYGTWHVTSS